MEIIFNLTDYRNELLEQAALLVERHAHSWDEIDDGQCNSDTCNYVCDAINSAANRVRQLKIKQPDQIQ